MKNIIIIVFAIFITQNTIAQKFNGGLSGSIVASQLDGDRLSGYNKLGFAIGGYINRFLSEKIAIQMNIRYIQKGSKSDKKETSYSCFLQYAEIPVTLRYFRWNRLDIEAGLGMSYLIKNKEYLNGYPIINPPPFNKIELSSIVGINYCISNSIDIGVHFMYSLLFVRPHSENFNTMKSGQYNNLFTFSINYKLSHNII